MINALASDLRCELALQKHPEQLGRGADRVPGRSACPRQPSVALEAPAPAQQVPPRLRPADVSSARRPGGGRAPDLDASSRADLLAGGRRAVLHAPAGDHLRSARPGSGTWGCTGCRCSTRPTTGMHWQIQKGGGFHYYQAEKLGQPLELAVALGTDPALLHGDDRRAARRISTRRCSPGFLRGQADGIHAGASPSAIDVPAHAEFILEGVVPPRERRMEGPFGDHFGHYSHAAEFPGLPPQRGDAPTESGLSRHRRGHPADGRQVPGRRDPADPRSAGQADPLRDHGLWAYYEAGFHNLLVVAVDQRYGKRP